MRTAPRLGLILCVAILAILLGGVVLWGERKPIAASYVDRLLAQANVVGSYQIEQLGLGRQRITHVVIGDPAKPDLTAEWIELRTGLGWSGPELLSARAGRVRLAARLADGRLSFGAVDRLLPKSRSGPPILPDLDLGISDLVMQLEAPAGPLRLQGGGQGNLAHGFRGRFALTSPGLAAGGCASQAMAARLDVRTRGGKATIAGPGFVRAVRCGSVALSGARANASVTLASHFDHMTGQALVTLDRADASGVKAVSLSALSRFSGALTSPEGQLAVKADMIDAPGWSARGLFANGRYGLAGDRTYFKGRIGLEKGAAGRPVIGALAMAASPSTTNPAGDLIRGLGRASLAATAAFRAEANLATTISGGQLSARLSAIDLRAVSGAWATMRGPAIIYDTRGMRVDGLLAAGGGGLPTVRATLAGDLKTGMAGQVAIEPYSVGTSTIATTPTRFTWREEQMAFSTAISLSVPLGGGRLERLRFPLSGTYSDAGTLTIGRSCITASFERLAVEGLVLGGTQLPLCPIDGAMLKVTGGRLGGGIAAGKIRLAGTLAEAPFAGSADRAALRMGEMQIRLAGVSAQFGAPGHVTRLDVGEIGGAMEKGGFAGRFDDAAGQIANVPLLLSHAAGDWRLAGARLAIMGATNVSDSADVPRFRPLRAGDVQLSLDGGAILATGALVEPVHGVSIADVSITHRLGDGTGSASFTVPGIVFGKGFQPDDLTPLTFGVIADAKGDLSGEGRIDWSSQGVTSGGTFRTAGFDFAAALGPVTGVSGAIRFTDLLALESAPGQEVHVAGINPGVPVNDGVLHIQTLSGARVQVEQGIWPFAGGTLRLRPTLLDFSRPVERAMTFEVSRVDAGQFLQQFDFKNLTATGTFDGTLPMIFDASGGRIEGGQLAVRSTLGGTIAYVGEVSQEDLGLWGNFAFQALKSLHYRSLEIVMNGPLAGEMVTEVKFAGIAQGEGAKRNFIIDRLQKLPLVFNVQIRAPFRQLVDSAQSFYDPRRLIERNLPALIEQQKGAKPAPPPVQPR